MVLAVGSGTNKKDAMNNTAIAFLNNLDFDSFKYR